MIGVKALAALLSLTILGYSFFYWSTYRNAQASVQNGGALPSLAAGKRDVDGTAQNILLLGNDSRTGATPAELAALATTNDGGSANTDTMMVMHIPSDGSKATVLSFPRDGYIAIPGYGMNKLNAAYPDGYVAAKNSGASETAAQGAGVSLLARTLDDLTGLHIDHYVQVDLLGFYRISNAIGGIPVLLCQAQKEPLSGINLHAGWNTIAGTQALAFVRQRHNLPLGDLNRIQRQQYFLSAVFKQLTASGTLLNPLKVGSLLNAVSASLLTDGVNLLSLASDFASMSSGNLTFKTIPTDGNITTDAGASLAVNPDEVAAFVDQQIGVTSDPSFASATAATPASVNVTVLNASAPSGSATQASTALQQLGFQSQVGNYSGNGSGITMVEYPQGMQAQAKALLKSVPGATPILSSSVTQLTLVLGGDSITVSGTHPSSSPPPSPPGPPANSAVPATPSGSVQAGAPNQPGCVT